MKIFALADLHLSFSLPNKSMNTFGGVWVDHHLEIKSKWNSLVSSDDLVLIPGDISWGSSLQEAEKDLHWIDALNGKKVLSKGNHDFWWSSKKKLDGMGFTSLTFLDKDVYSPHPSIHIIANKFADSQEFSFEKYIQIKGELRKKTDEQIEREKKQYDKEITRLTNTLNMIKSKSGIKICMLHYPPLSGEMESSHASDLLEKSGITHCVFGHLHSVKEHGLPFGTKNGISYYLTSCDYLQNTPLEITSLSHHPLHYQ